jgi:hypothetical protein
MNTPNRLDDRFHVGLIAIVLGLAIAVIAGQPDLEPVQAEARVEQPTPMALNATLDEIAASGVAA